jgi:ATP:corrinoid adenosyltransferase
MPRGTEAITRWFIMEETNIATYKLLSVEELPQIIDAKPEHMDRLLRIVSSISFY